MTISLVERNGNSEKYLSGNLGCVASKRLFCLRWFFVQVLVISAVGCNVQKQSESSAKPATWSEHPLSGEEARRALIRMIELDHQDDRLLQGALPYLRTNRMKQVGNDTVEIGTWTCYLKEHSFKGEYISPQQKIYADFAGNFVCDKQGQWKGVISDQRRTE
jgi:hypothetical protein